MTTLHGNFSAMRCSQDEAFTSMRRIYDEHKKIICPHTATAVYAAEKMDSLLSGKTVIVETAHPAKFSAAVEKAIGVKPALPPVASDIMTAEEHFETSAASEQNIQQVIDKRFNSH